MRLTCIEPFVCFSVRSTPARTKGGADSNIVNAGGAGEDTGQNGIPEG